MELRKSICESGTDGSPSLKSRHIQFIALGGTIGTGLFLGIGSAFTKAGPLSLLLGYTFTGAAVFAMMMSLGEMATWLPLPGAIPQFCARYVDGAMGFAVGWNVSVPVYLKQISHLTLQLELVLMLPDALHRTFSRCRNHTILAWSRWYQRRGMDLHNHRAGGMPKYFRRLGLRRS